MPFTPRQPLTAAELNDLEALANGALQSADLADIALQLSQIYVGTITLTQPLGNRIHQRTTRTGGLWSKGSGTVPITISCDEPMARLDVRLRDNANPLTTLQDWTTQDFSRTTGTQELSIPVPAGLYGYLIDLRPNQDASKIVSTTVPVLVGELIAIAGQSLAEDMFSPVASGDSTTIAASGLSISAWGRVFAAYATNGGAFPAVPDFGETNYPPPGWLLPSDSGDFDSTGCVELINRIVAQHAIPVGVLGYAVGGTGIDSWLPGYAGSGSAHYEKLEAILDDGGFNGSSTFIWFHGHYESKNGNTAENHLAQLELLFSTITDRYGDCKKVICSIGGIGTYTGSVANINRVRATTLAYVASDPDAYYFDALDATLDPDLVHASQAGNILIAREMYRAFRQAHGLASYGARGPLITGASRAYTSATIVLAIDQTAGGTAWVETGNCIDQFVVYNDAAPTTPLTISDLDVSDPAEIGIILAAAPSEPASLKVWYRPSPDTAAIIGHTLRDNATDGDGITYGRQLGITGEYISVAFPVVVLTIAAISDTTAAASLSLSGAYSNGAPSSLEYSVDLGTTWTAATSPTIAGGNWSFAVAAGLPVGIYRIMVRDPVSGGYGTSNTFAVAQVSAPAWPTISGAVFRLDASLPSAHLYADTNRTVQVVNGEAVRGVADKTGTGNHFRQTTESASPLFVANAKNGLPGIRFNGTLSQYLSLVSGGTLGTTLKAASAYTIFAIYTPLSVPDVAATVFGASQLAKSGGFNIIRGSQGLSTAVARASRNADAASYQTAVAAGWVVSRVNNQVDRYTGTQLKTKINALTESLVSTGTLGSAAFDTITIGVEGSNQVLEFYFNGYLHCLAIWTTSASDSDRDALITYGTTQWGS